MKPRAFVLPVVLILASVGAVGFLKFAPPPNPDSPSQQALAPAPLEAVKRPVSNSLENTPVLVEAPQSSVTTDWAAPAPDLLRNVSPEGIITPRVDGPLTRVEARLPKVKKPVTEDSGPTGPVIVIRRPQVVSAGVLEGNNLTLELAHVTALSPGALCPSDLGPEWPCGARARTALRAVVRLYAVTCHKVADLGERHVSATCSRGTLDLNRWLVEYGWAVPDIDAPEEFATLSHAAKEAGKGQWKRDWAPLLLDGNDTPLPEAPVQTSDLASGTDNPVGLSDFERLPQQPQPLLRETPSGVDQAQPN